MWKLRLLSLLSIGIALGPGPGCGGGAQHSGEAVPVAATGTLAPFALAQEAGAGVDDTNLRDLLVRHWDQKMRANPVWAGTVGDHRFDDLLSDKSPQALSARREETRKLLQEAQDIDSKALSSRDQVTLALFAETLARSVDRQVCQNHQWSVSSRGNPVSSANVLSDDHKVTDLKSARSLVKRFQKIPTSIDQSIANLRIGLKQGRVANAESLRRTMALVRGQLDTPLADWALLKPVEVLRGLSVVEEKDRTALVEQMLSLVGGPIRESFVRYLAVLKDELLPAGRSGAAIGVHALPQGLACYQASMRAHINLERSAEEIHKLGLQELTAINQAMTELGTQLFKTATLAETIAQLRGKRELYFESKEEIVAKAEASLSKAKAAIPAVFGILPKADCRVVEIPDFEAPFTTIAYYKQPQSDTNKPGEYFINTFKPETRPRFEMEVLAFHESIPGHHLQIAISQEREDLPLFRRYGGSTAFVEGWALYSERLADEMNLYSSQLDRMGMLSYDAWRASRLVVDTGIHTMGWTRAQAEEFMGTHTALTKSNIANEVDRYISWPGQAVAYKVGQLEILRLREAARTALGERFELRGFHDVVLKSGAVTLLVLAQQVEAWVASVVGSGS